METTELVFAAQQRDLSTSAVSWGATIAGAFVAAAVSFIMLALGAGLGLSAVSPWSNFGAAAATVGTVAIAWLVAMQVIAWGLGGYLVGRLRTRWPSIHGDETHFRDTANGLVAWAVGVILTASFLATAATTMAGGSLADSTDATLSNSNAYMVDRLFRPDHPGTEPAAALPAADGDLRYQAEASRILAQSLSGVSGPDSGYLTQLVAARTGLSPADAGKRVAETIAGARLAEDGLRKATARLLLWIFIALLAGAFCASYAATLGGRQRDRVQMI